MNTELKKLNLLFSKYKLKNSKSFVISNKKPVNNTRIILSNKKINNKDIVVVVAAHKRLRLLNFVISYLNELDFKKIVVVYSENNEKKVVNKYSKVSTVYSPNIPVSKKWQKGVEYSRKFKPDGVMILGSDDIITPGYLYYVKKNLNKGVDYISNRIWYNTYLTDTNFYIVEFQYLKPRIDGLGSGRVYSKNVLNKLNWKLYNFSKNKGLDGTSYAIAKKYIKKSIIINNLHQMNVILLKTEKEQNSISVKNGFFKWVKDCTEKKKTLRKISLYRAGESNAYKLLYMLFFNKL